MKAPKEPGYSCPHLDEAISEIEKARAIHDELRKWGSYWEEKYSEIEKELTAEIKNRDERITTLEYELTESNRAIEKLNQEINNLEKITI